MAQVFFSILMGVDDKQDEYGSCGWDAFSFKNTVLKITKHYESGEIDQYVACFLMCVKPMKGAISGKAGGGVAGKRGDGS